MVQLPVPPQIDPRAIFETIAPEKDADGKIQQIAARLWKADNGKFICSKKGGHGA
jgi:methylenetetrahydrofolate dehydrogenase (NADP+)/methenyltetrahydrofolate cyclohydrolase